VNNQRSSYKFIIASILGLLLLVIGGFYWFVSQKSGVTIIPLSQPDAAIFVSKRSPVMVTLLVNPDRLQALERKGEISQIKTNLFAKTSIDYPQDIQPWLSNEITLAVTTLDIDGDPENGMQPGYLMALATKNREMSRGFIEYLFSRRAFAGADLVVEQYKGIEIISDQHKSALYVPSTLTTGVTSSLASAVVNNFVLFANDSKVIKSAINNLQAPDLDLTSFPQYQKTIQQLPKNALAMAFLNLPAVAQWQGLKLAEVVYDSQIISLVLQPFRLLAESTFLAKSPITHSASLSQPTAILQYIPQTAGLVVVGHNLQNLANSDLGKLWQQGVITLYGSQAATTRLPEFLTQMSNRWGLNFSNDIFSWVTGEYSIALLPSPKHPQWVFVTEKSSSLKNGIANLDAIALKNGFSVSYFDLNQQQVSAWTQVKAVNDPKNMPINVDTQILGVHTSVDNYEIFASDLQTLDRILTKSQNDIMKNALFQDLMAVIPQPNQGLLYVDWQKSQEIIEGQLPLLKYLEVLAKPLFEHLQAIAVSNYSNDIECLKMGVFWQMSK